jgi:hypothetical protein
MQGRRQTHRRAAELLRRTDAPLARRLHRKGGKHLGTVPAPDERNAIVGEGPVPDAAGVAAPVIESVRRGRQPVGLLGHMLSRRRRPTGSV